MNTKYLRKFAFLILSTCLSLTLFSANAHAQESSPRIVNDIASRISGEIKPESIVNRVYLLRHFEKQVADSQATYSKDPELTTQGEMRAQSLAKYLSDANIIAIYSTDYKRTQQSVKPIADKLGLRVNSYDPSKLEAFAMQLQAISATSQGDILVVGHSNTTPELLKLLGGPQISMTENDYGDLFYLNLSEDKAKATSSFHKTTIQVQTK
ncbi:histidine phosphatase family protein [Glaciecola sp.]|jgi:phosphohistidine phosphatase SixA|uniref:histidine phosphatase family protein n=1 Tax=Glaciecola sp. MF2-115 TaxID=3384827 RepID=UPI00398A04BD